VPGEPGLGPGAGEKWISTGGDEGRDCREGREDDGFEGVYSYSLVYQFGFDNEKILLITLMRHFDSTLMQQDS
ncbi:MAG: hypothetical protein IJQ93_12935, partial [Bacteroidales bacterium]|nr:hypothetical protein [Bacteroidales bacterium]